MAKHLLQHAIFTGAARKKARFLQKEADTASAAFFSNSKPTMMKAEPWDAAGHDMGFPFSSGCDGRHDRSASSTGPARRDHGNKRPSGNSNQKFTTVPYYDGHEWRKYGEKNISGLDFPRCYYRCTYSPCPAKKRVEQISHDYPPMYLVTYQKEHTCNVSSSGANSPAVAVAVAAVAPKAEPVFLPFATQVHESLVVEQKHSPSTPSTITDGSCAETCSSQDQPALTEVSTLESMEIVNYDELTSFLYDCSPDLPILSDLVELETANYHESGISPTSGDASPSPAHFPDLAPLECSDMGYMAANSEALDLAGDMLGFLEEQQAPACFDSSYLDVLDQLGFDEVDSLNHLWSW